jgi:IMP dehydrogenase
MQLMTDNRIRHLPILDNIKVIGLISIGDVVKEMLVQQKNQIEELQKYISG